MPPTIFRATIPPGPWPFLAAGALAILVGGSLSAALAHAPTRPVMWLVAYLVLVVGAAQIVLGAGQWRLAVRPRSTAMLALQWLLFNGANGLVMAGRLLACPAAVAAGTLVLFIALALFWHGVRGARSGWVARAYRAFVVLLGGSALVGIGLSLWRAAA